MHILLSLTIGILVAIGVAIGAVDTLAAILYSPLIVSGTVVALSCLPMHRTRPER